MKDLERLVAACKADLDSLGIPYGNVAKWEINTRAKHRWGRCVKTANGTYTISIAQRLLQDAVREQAAKDTIMHELLHTVNGCFRHTGKWKLLAGQVNRCLPQYTVKTTTSAEEKGIAQPEPKYIVKCLGCGQQCNRDRMTAFVRHPERYTCGICGKRFKRIR